MCTWDTLTLPTTSSWSGAWPSLDASEWLGHLGSGGQCAHWVLSSAHWPLTNELWGLGVDELLPRDIHR